MQDMINNVYNTLKTSTAELHKKIEEYNAKKRKEVNQNDDSG